MYKAFSILSLACLLNGCAPVAFMGATTTVATSAAEERGLGGVISDTEIKARIFSLYGESDLPLNSEIDIVVRQGVVLLSGVVDSQKIQLEAVRLAWLAKGVKEVHDEITVGPHEGLGTTAKDSWISTQLKTKILFDEKVSSINYNLHTVHGVVYLMGIAKSQQELDHVVHMARHTSGVKKVISYVRVQDPPMGAPIGQGPSQPDAATAYGEPAQEAIGSGAQKPHSSQEPLYQGSAFD
jgi:osmotically-inducible protein OsmY